MEKRGAVVFADFPFAVVDCPVVVGAQGDGVIDIGGAVVEPFGDVVDLAIDSGDGAPGGLATTIPGQNRPTLGWSEQAVGPVLG